MSLPPVLHAFQALDIPPRFPRRELPMGPLPVPPVASVGHPILFLAGAFLAIGFVVIALWQGLGLLLPH